MVFDEIIADATNRKMAKKQKANAALLMGFKALSNCVKLQVSACIESLHNTLERQSMSQVGKTKTLIGRWISSTQMALQEIVPLQLRDGEYFIGRNTGVMCKLKHGEMKQESIGCKRLQSDDGS